MNSKLNKNRILQLKSFIQNLSLPVKNLVLLNQSLTHGSYVKESSGEALNDNERLEFFGDAVLKLYISEYLMDKYVSYSEGQLSNIRAFVVSEKTLLKIANEVKIKDFILVGKNEKKSLPTSILADSLEAMLAVIYFDCGPIAAKDFILKYWIKHIIEADKSKDKENFKASLQEYTQANKLGLPEYKTVLEKGPDHNKFFEIAVCFNNKVYANGSGKTKKEASQDAARKALRIIRNDK